MNNQRSASIDIGANHSTDRGWRGAIVAVLDFVAWPISLSAATAFYGNSLTEAPLPALMVVAIIAQFGVGMVTGLYRGRFRQFSFDEAGAVAVSAGATGVIVIVTEYLVANDGRAGQIIVMSTSIAVCLMFGHRYLRRIRARRAAMIKNRDRTPIIVWGAGEGGYRAIHAMQSVSDSPYRPVALIDDDPAKRRRHIGGIRVQGNSDDLERVAHRQQAQAVLLAMPSADGRELRAHQQLVKEAGLDTLVMPPVQRLVGEGSPREITRYIDEDVLNRRIVDIDGEVVGRLVADARVLVTGAGGSIGSELVRQLALLSPASLIALDRDDSLLHAVAASLAPEHRPSCTAVIADIRDIERLDEVFEHHRPQLVFHAAALKHVPALEGAPSEGWKTNVIGSSNILEVCERHDVHRVVNISTDKAANPTNVLGFTKRIAERLTASSAERTGRPYVSVRFGNVIGSRGSALETFALQISEGGPVTITDPNVTRYFMAVREAVRLTMQAAAIGRAGEVLVLDMGTPVRVIDVARQLIDQSGTDVEIVYTGLRPGEKMHEVLLGDREEAKRPFHEMIDHVGVAPVDLVDLLDTCTAAGIAPTSLEGLALMSSHDYGTLADTAVTVDERRRQTPSTRSRP